MNGRAYRDDNDLAGGVYESEGEPVRPLGPSVPSCPWCGKDGVATFVGRTDGRYYCACGSLFNGTDAEWQALARHRRETAERAVGKRKPLPVQGHKRGVG